MLKLYISLCFFRFSTVFRFFATNMSGKSPKASLKTSSGFTLTVVETLVGQWFLAWQLAGHSVKNICLVANKKKKNRCQICPNISSNMSCFVTTNAAVVCSDVSFKLSSGFMPTNNETLCQTAFVVTDAARIVPDNNKDNNGSVATNMAGKCPDVSFKNIQWLHAYKCANAVMDSGLSLGSCLDV